MKAKENLAAALSEAGLVAMSEKAATGFYADFESPLTFPIMQLVADLTEAGARDLAQRAMDGEFDGE